MALIAVVFAIVLPTIGARSLYSQILETGSGGTTQQVSDDAGITEEESGEEASSDAGELTTLEREFRMTITKSSLIASLADLQERLRIAVTDHADFPIAAEVKITDASEQYLVSIRPVGTIHPGMYHITGTLDAPSREIRRIFSHLDEELTDELLFTHAVSLGELAWNIDQEYSIAGTQAIIHAALVPEGDHVDCPTDISADIRDPEGSPVEPLSVSDRDCNDPLSSIEISVPLNEAGEYAMTLSASSGSLTYTAKTQLVASADPKFVHLRRDAPTVVRAGDELPMTIDLRPSQSFEGTIRENIPEGWAVDHVSPEGEAKDGTITWTGTWDKDVSLQYTLHPTEEQNGHTEWGNLEIRGNVIGESADIEPTDESTSSSPSSAETSSERTATDPSTDEAASSSATSSENVSSETSSDESSSVSSESSSSASSEPTDGETGGILDLARFARSLIADILGPSEDPVLFSEQRSWEAIVLPAKPVEENPFADASSVSSESSSAASDEADSQRDPVLSLDPTRKNFPANAPATFTVLEGDIPELPGEDGSTVSDAEALSILADRLVSDDDIAKAVVQSAILDQKAMIADEIVSDTTSMNDLREALDVNGSVRRSDTVTTHVSEAIERSKELREVLADTVIEHEPELLDAVRETIDDDTRRDVVRAAVEAMTDEGGTLDDATEAIATVAESLPVQSEISQAISDTVRDENLERGIIVDNIVAPHSAGTEEEKPLFQVRLKDKDGNTFEPGYHFEKGSIVLAIEPERQFAPGMYTLVVTIRNPLTGETETIEQDFAWGVLAMNPNQDRFVKGSTGRIDIGVLDDKGYILCNADLSLSITSPSGEVILLSTDDNSISITNTCGTKSSTNVSPDYAAFMTFAEAGTYDLHLEAKTENGGRSLDQHLTVEEYPPFVVARTAATRLWPFGIAPMTIDVKFYEDYSGTITDIVPAGFVVSDASPNAEIAPVETGTGTTIAWKGSWQAGDTATFTYDYDAPNVSPQFFLIGPLHIGNREEMRSWQIANDAAKTWDGGGLTNNCSTAANWSGDTIPTTTDDIILDSTSTKAMTWDSGCPSTVASWTQSSGYTNTVTVSISSLTVNGTMSIADGTFTAPSGTLTVKGSFIQTAGTFSHNNGTMLLAPTGSQSLSLTATSNLNNLTLDSGLMQYWKLDDLTGSVARDSSRTRSNGTLMNSPTWSGSNLNSVLKYYNPGGLKTVGASTQYFTASYTSEAVNTISLWVKTTSTINSTSSCLNLAQFSGGQYIGLGNCSTTTTTESVGMYSDTVSHFTYSGPTISPGWHYLVYSYSGGAWNLYLDGTWYGGSPSPASFGTHAYALSSVTAGSFGYTITGAIDDVRLYNRAIAYSEMNKLYAGNKSTGSGTYVLGGHLTVNGNLGIYDGTLDASSNNYNVTVKGNADIQGDFIKRAGTFTMSGTGPQTLSGSTVFNNLSITASSARTAYLDFTSRQSVSGSLVLHGVSGNNLSLRSTKIGSGARILYDADSTQLAADIAYVSVKDSYADGGQSLACSKTSEECLDNGNTRNWVIQTSNISGTVYTDQGTTAATSPTVGLTINGAPFITTTANSSGQFTFSNVFMTGSTVLGLFVSGNTTKAATVVVGSGSSMTGIDLYGNTLILRSEPGTIPVTNALVKIAANGGGSDMAAVYAVNGNNDLTLTPGKSLTILSNTTHNPGGRISAADFRNYGTVAMSTSGLALSGSLITDSGTFSTSTGTLLRSQSTTTNSLHLGSNSLGKLSMNTGLVGYWKFDDRTGTLARDVSPYRNNGTLSGTPSVMWSGSDLVSRLRFYNNSAIRFTSTSNNVTVPHTSSLTFSSAMTVSTWVKLLGSTPTATCGSPPAAAQYLLYKRNNNPGGGGYNGYSLTTSGTQWGFSMCAATTCYGAASTTVPVIGSWVHLVGVFKSGTMKLYVNGVLESSATGPSTVDDRGESLVFGRTNYCGQPSGNYDAYLNGELDDVRLYNRDLSASEVSSLYNGNKSTGTNAYSTNGNITVAGNLDIYSGELSLNGNNLDVSGNANIQGDFTPVGGTVTLNGSGPQTLSGSTVFSNLTKTVSAASTLYLDYTSRQSVSGALILRGASNNLLSLRSTKVGSGARILLDADAGSQTIDYLNVRDSDASGGQTLACDAVSEGCVGGSNNTNWQMYTNTISGTVYTDQGVTPAVSPTVRLAINGSVYGSTTANSSGQFSFSNVSMTGSSVISLYTVGSTPAVTLVGGVQSVMTGLDLYGNSFILRTEDGSTSMTNAIISNGTGNGSSDTARIYSVNGSDLIVQPGKTLYIWSGKTYVPGGNVAAGSVKNLGTITMGTNTLRVANTLTTSAGTITTSTGVVLRPISAGGTLTLGSNTLQKVVLGYDMATGNAGPVGSWDFNEASGTTSYDGSGNGNHATLVNSPTRSAILPPVFYGNSGSLLFSSSAQYANVTSASALNPGTSNFTLSIWIKPTSIPASSSYTIISKYNYNGGVVPDKGYILSLNSAGKIVGYVDSDNPDIVSTSTVGTSQWTHVVLTYNNASATAKIFLNGVLDKTQTGLTSRNATSTRDLTFGYSALTGLNFAGTFDEIRLYNRELSNAEIALLAAGYNQPVNGTYTLGSALGLSNNLTISSGATLDVSGGNYGITVGGDWLNKGTFVRQGGTVTFNGSSTQTLSGSTIFQNLAATASAARTLNLAAGTRQTVSGSLTLTGTTGNRLSLRSTSTGNQAYLLLDGDAGTQSISELDVKDSNASGGQSLICVSCGNSGNNTNWIFPITGTVYSDAGVTPIGAGHTVAISVDGGTPTTTTTDSSGNYQLNTTASAGSIIAIYLTGTTGEDGAVVSVTDGNPNSIHYDVYKDELIVRNDNGGTTTNANLATAATYGDTQLAEVYSVSAGTLTMQQGKRLRVLSGHTFAPGGTVNAKDLTIAGTFTMGSNAVNVAGNWDSTSGTFTGSNTVTFTASGSIRRGSSSFNHLVFNANNGRWIPVSSLAAAGNLTISAGTLNLSGSSLAVSGTFRNDATLRMHGNETLTTVTNDTAHGGTVWYDGSSSYTGLNGFTSFANLTLSGAGTWSLNNDITTAGNVTVTTGTLLQRQKTVTVGGNWTDNANFTASGSMVFTGNGTITEPRGFKALTINAAGSTVELGRALTVSGSITITAGTLDVSSSNHRLTLSGSLTNNGTFNARAGTVVLNGGNQSIAGSSNTTFYNLTKTVASAATLTLPTGATTTTQGATTLQGSPGQLLSLRSSISGTKAPFTIGATGRSISYVDVKDQNNAGSSVVCDTICSNSLNNIGWSFPVSVNVYTDAGTTPAADGTTVALGLNGVLQATEDTVSGSARFTSVEIAPGDILTLWISGESIKGATVVVTDAQQLSLPLYKNTLILRNDGASNITNANIATATVSDSDLSAVYGVSGGALTMSAGKVLLIPSGHTFAPGGTVNAKDLTIAGTFTMGSNAVNVAGNWDSTSGTFTGSNTVTFTASGSIRRGSSSFNHLVFNANNGRWIPVSSLAAAGNLTISAGTLNLSGSSLAVSGTFRNDATLRMHGNETLTTVTNDTAHGGTVWYDGSSSYTGLNGFTSFANLTLSGAGTWSLNNDITTAGNVTVTTGTLLQRQKTVTVGGNWTDTGTFAGSGSTVFTATASVVEPAHFGSVTINAPSQTVTLGSPLNVSGSLILRSGTLDVGSNKTISVDGTWEKETNGSFTQGTGTVRLTGTHQTLSGSTTFYNLMKRTSAATTLTFMAGSTQTVQGTWTMRGSAGNTLTMQSSTEGQQWSINPTNYDLQYISVGDSNNTSGTTILAANDATNAGNNTGWAFPMVVTVVHRDGSAYTSGITVTAIVNNDSPVTSTTNGSGIATFNDGNPSHLVPNLESGALLALHFGTGTETGSLITLTNGTSLGFTLYGNTLSVESQNGSAISNSIVNTASGMLLGANLSLVYSMSGTSLVMNDGVRLRNSEGRYAPGSKIYAEDIRIIGNFEMGDDDVRISGEWDATDGIFTADNTVYFTATGTEDIISNGNYFHDVVFIVEDGSSAHWTFVDAFQYTGTVTIVNPSGSTDLFAPIVSDVTATAITETTARIIWRTNEASTEQVRYGTGSGLYYRSASGNGEDYNMTHVIFLTNLDPGTEYFFKAYSTDAGDNVGSSTELSFTTIFSDTTPPVITDTATGSVTTTTAQITWNTDETATGAILYGTEEDALTSIVSGGNSYNMHHVLNMTGLTPGTEYFFKVQSTDDSRNASESTVYSFTTTSLDTTPPVISSTATGSLTTTSVLVTWNTNESATGAVLYGLEEDALSQIATTGNSFNMHHAVALSGLTPGTQYFFKVQSTDTSGNASEDDVLSFTTRSIDTTPPVITDTATGSVTTTTAQIIWNTDETATGAILYGTEEDSLTGRVPSDGSYNMHHILSMTGLTPGTQYFFKVQSTDTSGNASEDDVLSFTTISQDTTPPTISDTATGSLTTTSVMIEWRTDEVTTEIVHYGTDSSTLSESATTGTNNMRHFVPLTNLTPGTLYYYQVTSVDTAGNLTTGDLLSFTTVSDDNTSPTVSDLTAALVSDTAAVLTWSTDEGAQSLVEFGTDSESLTESTSSTSLDYSHYVMLDELAANTTYYYRITATDAASNSTIESVGSFTTRETLSTETEVQAAISSAVSAVPRSGGGWRDVQPPAMSNIAVTALTAESVTIEWATDEPATSLLKLGKDSADERGMFDPSSFTGEFDHSVTIPNLSPDTTYKFVAVSFDAAGNVGLAEEQTFTTPAKINEETSSEESLHPAAEEEQKTGMDAFTAALEETVSAAKALQGAVDKAAYELALRQGISTLRTIANATLPAVFSSEPKVQVTETTATITWTTDEPGNSLVSYGPESTFAVSGYLQTSGNADESTNEHSITLHDLQPGTRYHYAARTVTILGTEAASSDLVFTTLQNTVEILSFKAETLSDDSARFTWTTSAPTTSAVTATPYLDGVLVPEQAIRETKADFGTIHSLVIANLDPSTFYDVDLWGTTPSGLNVSKVINRFVTAKDGIPLEVTDIQTNAALLPGKDNRVQAVVTWNTNISATSAVSFQKGISAEGTGSLLQVLPPLVSYTRKHVVLLPNLDPGTVYSFRVESRDAEGGTVTSRMYTILTPRQEESVFDIITHQIESLFGWLGNLRT